MCAAPLHGLGAYEVGVSILNQGHRWNSVGVVRQQQAVGVDEIERFCMSAQEEEVRGKLDSDIPLSKKPMSHRSDRGKLNPSSEPESRLAQLGEATPMTQSQPTDPEKQIDEDEAVER